jgi:hypothetical protein
MQFGELPRPGLLLELAQRLLLNVALGRPPRACEREEESSGHAFVARGPLEERGYFFTSAFSVTPARSWIASATVSERPGSPSRSDAYASRDG